MGKRDKGQRETKKPKKGAKKILATIVPSAVTVEVIKKGKREEEEE